MVKIRVPNLDVFPILVRKMVSNWRISHVIRCIVDAGRSPSSKNTLRLLPVPGEFVINRWK